MDTRVSTGTRLSLLPVLIALLMNLVIGPLAPVIQQGESDVLGALVFISDQDGANDEPGQKDLTRLGIDYAGLPTSVRVIFNLDDTQWSGNNSGDGCSLFDTDDDLNVNFSLCATVKGSPAALVNVSLYACEADAKVDRCTGPTLLTQSAGTTCTAAIQASDPFPTGDFHPNDAVVDCTIALADVGATAAELVNVCSYPSQEPNSDPSDCVLIIRDGAIRVTKVVINDNGGVATCDEFGFSINTNPVTNETFDDNPDCSNLVAVVPTNNQGVPVYTVTEPPVSGYATTYSNCTNLNVASGETEVCTITNNDQGATLTVTKIVVNDNGGTAVVADFPLFIDGSGVTSGVANNVTPGNHTVSETGLAGYTGVIGGDCAANGTVTIALGQAKNCTITNDDNSPGLTLVKSVTNDNGGSAAASAWTLTASGPTGFSGLGPSVSNGASFDAGTYNLSESGPDDYTGSAWVCVGGTQNDSDTVTLALGQSATCTITNDDDAPGLTLVKSVVNNDGGTATASQWTLTASGPTGFSGAGPSVSNGASFDAGTYNLSESGGPDGYTASDWVCVGGTQDDGDTVTLAIGESATCTITNDDQPGTLTVIKDVEGGDLTCADFSFSVDGDPAVAFEADCQNDIPVDAGTYTVTEDPEDGYTATFANSENASLNCDDLAIENNGSATCWITNTRDTGDLTVIKDLDPNDDPGLFNLLIDGNIEFADASDGDSTGAVTLETGTYAFGETAGTGTDLDDYQTSVSCLDGQTSVDATAGTGTNWSVDVTKDSDIVCTITNERETGDLTVIKDLTPNDDPGLFNLQIDEETEFADASDGDSTGAVTVNTGSHSVGETEGTDTLMSNYSSSIECVDGEDEIVATGAGAGPLLVEVGFGDDIVCTITNTRVTVGFDKANDLGDNATVEPGETIHYELIVTVNDGMATGVEVTDTLPDGLTYVADSALPSAGFSINGQNLKWTRDSLAEGVYKFEYDATVDADASGSLTNLGCVDADQNDELVCDETTVLVQNIVVNKTNGTSGAVVPGTVVDFTLTLDVTNGPIDDVVIEDQLPAGIGNATDISDGGIYDSTANTITWTLEDVVDNETLTYKATVTATASGAQTNVATITEGPCVGDGCDDDSTVTVRIPTLVIDKVASTETITISGPANALVATPSVVTWTLSYTLTSGPVTGVVITDVVPAGFTFLDAANGGTFAAGTVTWNLGTVTSSGSVSFRTTVNTATISRTAPTVNTAIIDSNETAPDNGQDSVTVTVVPPPLGGTPTPLPNTATGIGVNGAPVNVPVELLVAFFIGSLGALALANVRASSRRR